MELEISTATNKVSQGQRVNHSLLGYRIKITSKVLPSGRYVADIGTVTSPLYAKIFDICSARQKAHDLELAGMIVEIEEVYGKLEVR